MSLCKTTDPGLSALFRLHSRWAALFALRSHPMGIIQPRPRWLVRRPWLTAQSVTLSKRWLYVLQRDLSWCCWLTCIVRVQNFVGEIAEYLYRVSRLPSYGCHPRRARDFPGRSDAPYRIWWPVQKAVDLVLEVWAEWKCIQYTSPRRWCPWVPEVGTRIYPHWMHSGNNCSRKRTRGKVVRKVADSSI